LFFFFFFIPGFFASVHLKIPQHSPCTHPPLFPLFLSDFMCLNPPLAGLDGRPSPPPFFPSPPPTCFSFSFRLLPFCVLLEQSFGVFPPPPRPTRLSLLPHDLQAEPLTPFHCFFPFPVLSPLVFSPLFHGEQIPDLFYIITVVFIFPIPSYHSPSLMS